MNNNGVSFSSIINQLLQQGALTILETETRVFKPASLCIYEWNTYWLELPGIDKLLVGSTELVPSHSSWFQLRFENQLGLAKLQPMSSGKPVSTPIFVEVISPKFSTLQSHLAFYTSLLEDLFQQVARLPFTYQSPTGRSVLEALRPPTPLFTYHFLKHFGADLRSALMVILASPHRLLVDEEAFVSLGAASGVGPDAILDMVQHSSQWEKAEGHPLAKRLGGFVPARIMQNLPQETFDNPENRFILNFLRTLQLASENLVSQSWWKYVPVVDRQLILETQSLFLQALMHPVFEEVGEQTLLPLNSQVLLRKDGYRHMLELWQKFQQARRPLFEPLHHAIEVRDVATLYEFWAFFALVEQVGHILGVPPVLKLITSDAKGLEWSTRAYFGLVGTMIYNRTFMRSSHHFHSYSTPMRPDYTWEVNGKALMVFDAKFSMSSKDVSTVTDESETISVITIPSLDNLYKMHTYRDALNLKAAVILYPGNTSVFFDSQQGKLFQFDLSKCFSGNLSGIGAIPMWPGNNRELEELI